MKSYAPEAIRNVAVVGHGHCGKTTLTSAILFTSGAVTRLGSVDDGTAVTDYDPDELEKKISLQLALAHTDWVKTKINLIDTPGYGNFIFEAKAGLRAADAAVLLLDAVAGVEVQTERVWAFAKEFELPTLIVTNRMDRENSSAERTLESAQKRLDRAVTPIQIPIGIEHDFVGVIDLLEMKAYRYEPDASGKATPVDVPSELQEPAEEARRQLMEMVAELDDELMNKYLEEETLDSADLLKGLIRGIASRSIFPLVYTSGLTNVGTAQLLDTIVKLMPSPAAKASTANSADGTTTAVPCDPTGVSAGFVFKTIADPFAGKLSFVRLHSGRLSASEPLHNVTKDVDERVAALFQMQGKHSEPTSEAMAGDIVAIPKLKVTTTNDTLGAKDTKITFPPMSFPEPAMAFAIEPKTRGDEDKMASGLARICEEDPTVRFSRDPQTGEQLLSGMGERHVDVVVARLKKKFGVEVVLHTPKVPYRETIKRKVEAQGRHKKQSGGRGQFGDCWIRLEPLPRGGGFEFSDEIFGGSIPQNYRPAVEKGVQEAAARGFLAGFPVVDFKVTLYDGSFHAVDSSEIAFKIAGSLAFKKAMEQAKAVLLEPVMHVTVESPDEYMGDIIGQLNTRRGRIQGMEGGVVTAQVPLAEMLSFAPSLKSLTSGRGNYSMEFSHYDEVPTAVAQKVIEDAKHTASDSEAEAH